MSSVQYDPANWLLSLHRALADQLRDEINEYVQAAGNPVGLQAYEVVMDWPEADDVADYVQLPKTVIHIATDDIDNRRLGFGDGITKGVEDTTGDPDTVTHYEGNEHVVNFDVGVWASDKSGGSSARMVVYQMLYKLFGTEAGKRRVREKTQGVEIIRFNGGRFIVDRIGDVRIYRLIDAELVARVHSSTQLDTATIVDMEPEQDPDLEIDGSPIT